MYSGYFGSNYDSTLGFSQYWSLSILWLFAKTNPLSWCRLTVTSILFNQSLSPMVIPYRSHNKSIEVARYMSLRAMNIAIGALFVTVFFFISNHLKKKRWKLLLIIVDGKIFINNVPFFGKPSISR